MKNAVKALVRVSVFAGMLLCIVLSCTAAGVTGLPSAGNTTAVTSSAGTYSIAQTAVGVFPASGGRVYNVVSLRKGATELGYGYTTAGKQDILKNSQGVVFVAGGGSTWDVMRLSSNYSYKLYPEKAELNIWICEDDMMNGMKTQKKFSAVSVDGYTYFKSVMSGDIIKSTFVGALSSGDYAVEVFSFDTVSRTWSTATEKRTVSSLSELTA